MRKSCSVSQSALPLKAKCSVCHLPYPISYGEYQNKDNCKHYRGEQVIVKINGKKVVETVHVQVQEALAVELSLVQMGADRGSGIVKRAINLSLNDFIDENRFAFLHGNEKSIETHKQRKRVKQKTGFNTSQDLRISS